MSTSGVIHLNIASIDAVAFRGDVVRVSLPTAAGRISVRPGHQTLIGLLQPGLVVAHDAAGAETTFVVTTGFFEVRSGNDVVLLVDSVDAADSVDIEEIRRAKERVEEAMKQRDTMSAVEFAHLEETLVREINRLRVAQEYRGQ